MEEKKKALELQIDIDDNIAQGVYCNFVVVNHSDTEFVIDFIYLQPMQPKAKVRSRIITSPKHAKELVNVLSENIKRYESAYGSIEVEAKNAEQKEIVH